MALISQQHAFTINLTVDELRIVLKALGGRMKPEDAVAAKKLGDELTIKKAVMIRSITHENEKLIENLKAVGLWE